MTTTKPRWDSSNIEPDPWPNGRNPNQTDPGPPIPGQNCHIVIDGIGYIFADSMDYQQESRQSIGIESTAPFFGDPANQLDTQSSDLTMLLPIGQNDFSDGIGALRLELDPKGYESCNNLQLTPQNTLLNGPVIDTEGITGASPVDSDRWWQEGYYATMVRNTTPYDYFAIGRSVYLRQSGVWNLIATLNSPCTNLFGYSGYMLACAGDGQSILLSPSAPVNVAYTPFKGFSVNGNPFICYRDGRTYAAFLASPPAVSSVATETSPSTNYSSVAYAVQYLVQMPDSSWIQTRVSEPFYADKAADLEIVISAIPVRGYHGGRVYRKLYRSHNNDSSTLYLLVDYNTLLDQRISWVDQAFDDTTLTVAYPWNTYNNTAMIILTGGNVTHNMADPDVSPIWYPESGTSPATGDYVWQAQSFRDSSGNEAVVFGTTSGFFLWDGVSDIINTLRPQSYNFFNCFSLAVNHGQIYFTINRSTVKAWSASQETFIEGPWVSQFTSIDDIRLVAAGEYTFMAVSGYSKYTPYWSVAYYRFNGKIFDWESYFTYPSGPSGNSIRPIMGPLNSEHSFIFYNNNGETHQNIITLDPKYNNKQTTNVVFRSAMSDCGLPRLRKQVFAVMVRYLQYTPQISTTLSIASNVGDTTISLTDATQFNVGDWIALDDDIPIQQEYRKVTAKNSNTLTLTHAMGAPLGYSHGIGTSVFKCGATVILRNVFADTLPVQDIEIGGPYRADYLFSYMHLPNPVYTFLDGIKINYNDGTIMELVGWSMITGLNPPYYGKMDLNIRLQDYVKLPNSLFDNATALERRTDLETAYDKGMVVVQDQFNKTRKMRFQRLSFAYEEPKMRHSETKRNQATAHVSLIDIDAELMKQEALVLGIPTNQ